METKSIVRHTLHPFATHAFFPELKRNMKLTEKHSITSTMLITSSNHYKLKTKQIKNPGFLIQAKPKN